MKKMKSVHITALIAFVFITSLSVLRFVSFNAAMLDIGNMSQAIWSATQGEKLLVSSPQGTFSRLNGHSEYIYFLIALIYKVVPSPITLLVIQALLYSSAIYPVYHLAYQRLHSHKQALRIGLIYLIYPVAVTAVLFDFHGDTLAMPLILFAIYYLYQKDILKYSLFVLLSLACKIYVVIPISAFGLILFFKNKKREALITLILSGLWLCFVFFVRHKMSGEGILIEASSQVTGYAKGYFTEILDKAAVTNVADRVVNLIIVILPALFLGYKSIIWMVPGLIITISVLLSSGPGPSYDYRFHHYALAVPFFVLSIIEGARKLREKFEGEIEEKTGIFQNFLFKTNMENNITLALISIVIFNIIFVQTPLSPQFYLFSYLGSNEVPAFSLEKRDIIKRNITSKVIPSGNGVLADIFLASHMTNRWDIYSTHYTDEEGGKLLENQENALLNKVDYVAIDIFSAYFHMDTFKRVLGSKEFSPIFSRDGLLVFSKNDKKSKIKYQTRSESRSGIDTNEVNISLLHTEVRRQKENVYEFQYKWYLIDKTENFDSIIAMTSLVGEKQSRIVHISSLDAIQQDKWQEGQILTEVFIAELPEYIGEGKYQLETAFYDSSHPGFYILSKGSLVTQKVISGSLIVK